LAHIRSVFNEVRIVKPVMMRPDSSIFMVVCLKYKKLRDAISYENIDSMWYTHEISQAFLDDILRITSEIVVEEPLKYLQNSVKIILDIMRNSNNVGHEIENTFLDINHLTINAFFNKYLCMTEFPEKTWMLQIFMPTEKLRKLEHRSPQYHRSPHNQRRTKDHKPDADGFTIIGKKR
jgi:hypothetical protein